MPRIDAGPPAKPKRKRKPPSATQRARAQERSYGSQGRAVERQAQRQRASRGPSRRPVAFRPLRQRTDTFRVQRQRTRRTAERADRRVGDSPAVPRVPLKRSYSPREREAVKRIYRRAAERTGGSVLDLYDLGSTRQRRAMSLVSRRVRESEALDILRRDEATNYGPRAPNRPFQPSPGRRRTLGIPTATIEARLAIPGMAGGSTVGLQDVARRAVLPAEATYNVGRAFVEEPAATTRASIRTAKESIAGIPEGAKMVASAGWKAVTEGDTSELKAVLEQIGEDYERRYGPLVEGDMAEFRRRVQTEYGLTPYALDAAAFAGGAGQGAGALARSAPMARLAQAPGRAGAVARAIHTASRQDVARPRRRFGGGETGTREQRVSRNLLVAGGQRAVDRTRTAAYQRRARKAGWDVQEDGTLRAIPGRRQQRFDALRPGADEVVSMLNLRNRIPGLREAPGGIRRHIGGAQSIARLKLLNLSETRRRQVKKLLKPLSRDERDIGLPLMLRYGVKPGAAGVAALKRRRAKIVREREAQGYDVPEVIRETNDEIAVIDKVLEEPKRYLTPEAREVASELRDMQVEDALKVLPEQQETLRRLSPQAELLDVPRNLKSGEAAPDVGELERLAGMLEDSAVQQRKTGYYKIGGANEVHVQRMATQLREKIDAIQRGEDVDVDAPDPAEVIKDADDFTRRVREAAKEADLEEPAYWMSGLLDEIESTGRRQFTTGAGLRATELPSHRYTGEAHRLGVERQGMDVFETGMQRNLKRRVQHQLVTTNAEKYAYEWSLNGGKGRTISELETYARDNGIDLRSLTFMSPRLLRKRGDEGEAALARGAVVRGEQTARVADEALGEIHEEVRKRSTFEELLAEERQGVSDQRYLAYPSEVGEILENATRPSGTFQRSLEWLLKTKPSRVMLGLNPPWLGFQVLSNGMLAGVAGAGPRDLFGALKFDRWLAKHDPDAHAAFEAELGISKGRHWQTDLGHVSTGGRDIPVASRMAAGIRAFSHTKAGKIAHGANAPSRLMDAMLAADRAHTAFFRKAVWYSKARREARLKMGQAIQDTARAQSRLESVLRLPPHEQVRAIAENAELFEQHARHVDKWLGNYVKFSSFERKAIASNVLFYGWLRHSLRLTFYTLPIEHPAMANLLGNVGRMGAQEIKDLFGVPSTYNLPIYALSQVYAGTRRDAKRGRLEAANWSRVSPFMNALTQLEANQQAIGLVSPIYQAAVDQLFEESSFTGRTWKIEGQSTPDEGQRPANYFGSALGVLKPAIPGVSEGSPRGRILQRQLLSLAFPYRIAEDVELSPSQSDDALLWEPRPMHYRDEEAQAGVKRSRRQWREKGTGGAVLDQLLPAVRSRITPLPRIVEREREKEADARNRAMGRRRRRRSRASQYGGGSNQFGGSSSSNRYGGGGSRYGG